jgi:hypothetical protein
MFEHYEMLFIFLPSVFFTMPVSPVKYLIKIGNEKKIFEDFGCRNSSRNPESRKCKGCNLRLVESQSTVSLRNAYVVIDKEIPVPSEETFGYHCLLAEYISSVKKDAEKR